MIPKNCKVTQSQCLGRCKHGPTVVVYPKGEWFSLKDNGTDYKEFIDNYLVNPNSTAVAKFKMPDEEPKK